VRAVGTPELTTSLARLHGALDMGGLASACGGVIEDLAGPVPWQVRISASSGNRGLEDFAGVGALAGAVPEGTAGGRAPTPGGDDSSWAEFDLQFQGEIVGSLVVGVQEVQDRALWDALAGHLGTALVKLQLWMQAEEESCQRRLSQEVLGDISEILGSFDVEYLLAAICLEERPVAERVAEVGEPLFIMEVDLSGAPEALQTVRLDDLLVIPLKSGGRTVGVLQTANPTFTDPASPSVVAAEGICRLAAVAVENALLHQEAVQRERMATIGQVMAGLSHDIRNMLQSMKAGFYFLQMGVDTKNPEQVAEAVPLIGAAMERISGLVLDMLNYSKSRKPARRPTNLNALAEDIAGTMAPVADERNVSIRTSPDPAMGEVPADSNEIFRCLSNLVTNAIEAVDEGGTVEVSTRWPEGDAPAEIAVRDEGSGIPEEDQARVFDALFTTKGSKGTGLGLAVTKKILEEHGGEILLDSEPGSGTTFTIRLPKTV